MDPKDIDAIEFGIYSPEEIKAMAVCKIDNPKLPGPDEIPPAGCLYDRSMGYIDDEECPTCGLKKECMGHFGYIELAVPIPHPMYIKTIVSFLRCFCKQCYRLLLDKDQIELSGLTKYKRERRFEKVLEKLEKNDMCSHCSSPQPKIVNKPKDQTIVMEYKQKKGEDNAKISINLSVEEIKQIFDNIIDEDIILLGFNPSRIRPRNLIITVLPVLPPCSRPYVMADGNTCDDDLTLQYKEIININNQLFPDEENYHDLDDEKTVSHAREQKRVSSEQKRQKLIQTLRFRISTTFNNSQGKAKHPTDNRPIKCLKNRLSGKKGRIRSYLMGKRVNHSARTVIGADPTLKLGQIGIPREVAKIHTKPEVVNNYNIEWLQEIVDKGEANFWIKKQKDGTKTRINLGYALQRKGTQLLYGDIVVRGDIDIEQDKHGNVIVPMSSDPIEVVHIKENRNENLSKGDCIIRSKKKIINCPKNGNFKMKKGDVIVRGKNTFDRDDEDNVIIPKPRDKVEVIHILTGDETTLTNGDQLIRDNKLIDIVYPTQKKIRIRVGDVIERQLRGPEERYGRKVPGDIVLFNRQPTLHEGSMMAMEVVPGDHKTFRFNLAATKSYNADFDGDEMNTHAVQSYEAEAELRMLVATQHNMISAQESKPNIVIVQDSLLAAYMMTIKDFPLTKEQFKDIASKGERHDGSPLYNKTRIRHIKKILGNDDIYNGRGLFSLILPNDLYYECETNACSTQPVLKIQGGVIVEGGLNKKVLGGSHNSLIQILHKEYGVEIASNFIDNVQFITNNWLLVHGFTVGLKDCMITSEKSVTAIRDVLTQCYTKAQGIEEGTHNPGIREIRVTAALSQAKDIGMRIAKEAMDENNNFLTTVGSGAKGDFFNIAQLTGLLGQQNLEGNRVSPVLNHGKRTLPHYPFSELDKEKEYESRGFIRHSFIHGLNPEEFYFHAMSGREGISDTAMGTAKSGYIQRKIVKVCEDIQVKYDGTVRDAVGKIYQFSYGDNGLDPTRTVKVNGSQQVCDINRIAQRLNMVYENKPEKEEVNIPSSAKLKIIQKIHEEFPREKIDESSNLRDLRQQLQSLQMENDDSSDESEEEDVEEEDFEIDSECDEED